MSSAKRTDWGSPERFTSGDALRQPVPGGFCHLALLYEDDEAFAKSAFSFVQEGLSRDEPTLVAVTRHNSGLLRDELGRDARRVSFVDMEELGRNPGRIIPAWSAFCGEYTSGGRRARGIGEPVWKSRSQAALAECERHEALLNVALQEYPGFWLLCPYDSNGLGPESVEVALRTHRHVSSDGVRTSSDAYRPMADPFAGGLEAAPRDALELSFSGQAALPEVRRLVRQWTGASGLPYDGVESMVLAANEAAANSILHGGGKGRISLWSSSTSVVCEVRDEGHITDPLAGRRLPNREAESGRGLWLVHRLCDLVQIRSSARGTIVRMTIDSR